MGQLNVAGPVDGFLLLPEARGEISQHPHMTTAAEVSVPAQVIAHSKSLETFDTLVCFHPVLHKVFSGRWEGQWGLADSLPDCPSDLASVVV